MIKTGGKMILNSCEHGDSIIVYIGRDCPMCEAKNDIADLENKYATLVDQYAVLENDYNKLEDELNELKTN